MLSETRPSPHGFGSGFGLRIKRVQAPGRLKISHTRTIVTRSKALRHRNAVEALTASQVTLTASFWSIRCERARNAKR